MKKKGFDVSEGGSFRAPSTRESWGSRFGFIMAAAGSAVGLANIWRFPYMVGENGGAAFLFLYLFCLLLIGVPVFISEIWIGKREQGTPPSAFEKVGRSRLWWRAGFVTVITGFLVSSFYSVVAGWVLGYFFEAVRGALHFSQPLEAANHFNCLLSHPFWGLGFHFLFMFFSTAILFFGVKSGIERANRWFMPILIGILFFLVIRGLTLEGGIDGLVFLFKPDFSLLTPFAFLAALGHSFFTLSLGQGTMVTYGSYLKRETPLFSTALPVVAMDTLISILSAIAIFTMAFSDHIEPDSGPSLLFQTMPRIFSDLPYGGLVAVVFFLMVLLAAITSQISALEPAIAWFMEEKGWTRRSGAIVVAIFSFILGIPSALSASLFFKPSFLEMMDFLCNAILIPVGGFMAVVLLGWKSKKLWNWIQEEKMGFAARSYLLVTIRYTAPLLIILIFLHAMGIF